MAEQVLHALYELLRGVQAADDVSCCARRWPIRPDDVYHALLTVILRLVFLLYAPKSATCCLTARPSRATTRWPASTSACARTRRSILCIHTNPGRLASVRVFTRRASNAGAGHGRELRYVLESGKQIVDDDRRIGASERRDLVPGCRLVTLW